MVIVGTVVVGVEDVARAARFWTQALGYVCRDEMEDDWVVLIPRLGMGTAIALSETATPVQSHPRIHLDLYSDDQPAEVDRLVGLGATRVDWDGYTPSSDFVVLADTEGNRFCVVDKSVR